MIILVLDPAASTGYALVNVEADEEGWWSSADIFSYGYISVDTTSDYQGDHCIDLMARLQTIIDEHQIEHIVIEDFFFSRKTATGSNINVAFRTAIHILARQNGIPYTIISILAWKKYISGRSTPTKEQKKLWGPLPSKKIFIQDALWKRFSIRFPNHSLSEKSGKPILFRYDIVDVVAQSIYYVGSYMCVPLSGVTCSVELPNDVNLPTKGAGRGKRYVYVD